MPSDAMPHDALEVTRLWTTPDPPPNAEPAQLHVPGLGVFTIHKAGPNLYLSPRLVSQFVLMVERQTPYASEVKTVLDALPRDRDERADVSPDYTPIIRRTSTGNWIVSPGGPTAPTPPLSRWSWGDDATVEQTSALEPSGSTARANTAGTGSSRQSRRSR